MAVKIYCDGCGQLITGNHGNLHHTVTIESKVEGVTTQQGPFDTCQGCFERLNMNAWRHEGPVARADH